MDMIEKECRGCGEAKPLTAFNRRIGRCARHTSFQQDCESCAEVRADPGSYRGRCRVCSRGRGTKPKRRRRGGPPRVVPPEERKHACPADIRRAFDRAQTRHAAVAEIEQALAATPRSQEQARAKLRERLDNARSWAAYSLGTLDSLIAFATDSLAKHPTARNKRKTRELNHLIASVETWKRVLVIRYGLDGQDEAYTEIRGKLSRVIAYHANRSAREREEAEQQADLGILKAVEQWDPCHEKLAKFNTYANIKIRREAQARKDSHTAPGKCKDRDGSYRTQVSINANLSHDDGETSRADVFHPVSECDTASQATLQVDVARALQQLPLDQAVVLQAKSAGSTLQEIADEQGLTPGQVRGLLKKAKDTMRDLLAAHAPTVRG